jgi:hypothetical protein
MMPRTRRNTTPVRVRPGIASRQLAAEWERMGRPHFICRGAFERWQQQRRHPATPKREGWWARLLGLVFR